MIIIDPIERVITADAVDASTTQSLVNELKSKLNTVIEQFNLVVEEKYND